LKMCLSSATEREEGGRDDHWQERISYSARNLL